MYFDFEMRRLLLGLTSIVNQAPSQNLPPLIFQRLPTIVSCVSNLSTQVHEERMKVLRAKERDNNVQCDDHFQDNDYEDEEDFDDGYESEEEFKEINSRILELKKKNQQNGPSSFGKAEQIDEDSSDDDSDYEYIAGDLDLYDSALEGMDEILFVKDSLEGINMSNPELFENLLSELNGDMRNKFNQVMESAQQMKFREEQINQIIDKTALMTKQQKRAVVLNKSDNFNIAATC